ncbi:MAG: hypothetical protein PVI40_07685 [Chlamydiota bacterium]|jgi:hypothetical protein
MKTSVVIASIITQCDGIITSTRKSTVSEQKKRDVIVTALKIRLKAETLLKNRLLLERTEECRNNNLIVKTAILSTSSLLLFIFLFKGLGKNWNKSMKLSSCVSEIFTAALVLG